MSTGMIILIVVIAIVVLLVLWVMGTYNSLVTLRNRVRDAWSQIDVQLKRRFDLIPNLVETVKGYTKHESETFRKCRKSKKYLFKCNFTRRSNESRWRAYKSSK